MATRPPALWLPPLCLLLLGSGCLFKHHTTNVVRQNETQREVQFESLSARQAFSSKAFSEKSRESGTKTDVVAIPLLLWRSRMDILSENAYYNDQVAACDSNGDGMITEDEAVAYRPPAGYEQLAAVSATRAEMARRSTEAAPATPEKASPAVAEVAAKSDASPTAPLPVEPASYQSESPEKKQATESATP